MNDNRDSFSQSSGKERASQSDANKTARRFFSPKIPKKGRIRIAILIVLCLIIIRLLIPHCGGGTQKPQVAQSSVVKIPCLRMFFRVLSNRNL